MSGAAKVRGEYRPSGFPLVGLCGESDRCPIPSSTNVSILNQIDISCLGCSVELLLAPEVAPELAAG